MKTYYCLGFSGKRHDNKGRGYTTARGAQAACERAGDVPVETDAMRAKRPHRNDADGWDRLRMASGCPGR